MLAPPPSIFRRSPKPTPLIKKGQSSEKPPRDWSVTKPDEEFVQCTFLICKNLVKTMHGTGRFSLAVNYLKPPQLAFYWVSNTDDIILIVATHSKLKSDFTERDLNNLKDSFTYKFENDLVNSVLKMRKIQYQFLQIEKIDGGFSGALSPLVYANLWEKIIREGQLPNEYLIFDNISIKGSEIVKKIKTKSYSIVNSHEYRIPLNRVSEEMKVVILRRSNFARIIQHGHLHQINGEKMINRTPDEPHPYFKKLLKEYRGSAIFMDCVKCKSSMLGFPGNANCALCEKPAESEPVSSVVVEIGPDFYSISRRGPVV